MGYIADKPGVIILYKTRAFAETLDIKLNVILTNASHKEHFIKSLLDYDSGRCEGLLIHERTIAMGWRVRRPTALLFEDITSWDVATYKQALAIVHRI